MLEQLKGSRTDMADLRAGHVATNNVLSRHGETLVQIVDRLHTLNSRIDNVLVGGMGAMSTAIVEMDGSISGRCAPRQDRVVGRQQLRPFRPNVVLAYTLALGAAGPPNT